MDLLRENVGRLYGRYLAAAFGSALISSIYAMVDMAMVGQYQGSGGHRRSGGGGTHLESHLQSGTPHRDRRLGALRHGQGER